MVYPPATPALLAVLAVVLGTPGASVPPAGVMKGVVSLRAKAGTRGPSLSLGGLGLQSGALRGGGRTQRRESAAEEGQGVEEMVEEMDEINPDKESSMDTDDMEFDEGDTSEDGSDDEAEDSFLVTIP